MTEKSIAQLEGEMMEGALERNSLWYRYKTEVWNTNTPQSDTVHNIMRVLRAVRNIPEFAYVSVPITSGKYFYELQLANPDVTSVGKKSLLQKAIDHNYAAGWKYVEELKGWVTCPILYPADLTPAHQQWEQTHFQALWLSIIAEKGSELHMSEDWEYSNGGVEEFTHVMQLRLGMPRHKDLAFFNTKEDEDRERARMSSIKVYDHAGNTVALSQGIEKVQASLEWIGSKGFKAPKIENCLRLLNQTMGLLSQGFYQ